MCLRPPSTHPLCNQLRTSSTLTLSAQRGDACYCPCNSRHQRHARKLDSSIRRSRFQGQIGTMAVANGYLFSLLRTLERRAQAGYAALPPAWFRSSIAANPGDAALSNHDCSPTPSCTLTFGPVQRFWPIQCRSYTPPLAARERVVKPRQQTAFRVSWASQIGCASSRAARAHAMLPGQVVVRGHSTCSLGQRICANSKAFPRTNASLWQWLE